MRWRARLGARLPPFVVLSLVIPGRRCVRWVHCSLPDIPPNPPPSLSQDVCPLCCEELDISDKSFYPCKCGYQVCVWCWHKIKETENGKCPACRKDYGDNPHEFSEVDLADVVKAQKAKKAQVCRSTSEGGGMICMICIYDDDFQQQFRDDFDSARQCDAISLAPLHFSPRTSFRGRTRGGQPLIAWGGTRGRQWTEPLWPI